MEQGSPGKIVTHFFAWVGVLSALSGLTTQDGLYLIFSTAVLLISLLSFICGRRDARWRRKEDEKRTRMIYDYLNGTAGKTHPENAAMASGVSNTPEKENA